MCEVVIGNSTIGGSNRIHASDVHMRIQSDAVGITPNTIQTCRVHVQRNMHLVANSIRRKGREDLYPDWMPGKHQDDLAGVVRFRPKSSKNNAQISLPIAGSHQHICQLLQLSLIDFIKAIFHSTINVDDPINLGRDVSIYDPYCR